jgi:hypothetical protein
VRGGFPSGYIRRALSELLVVSALMAACGGFPTRASHPPATSVAGAPNGPLSRETTGGEAASPEASPSPGSTEAPIRILAEEIENHYPDALIFRLTATAGAPIQRVRLYYRVQGTSAPTYQPVEIPPAERVSAEYTWDTSRFTVAPSTPVFYAWELEDGAGNHLKTAERRIYYDDLRFNWRELSQTDLILRWYQGDQSFGEAVFQSAREALSEMKAGTREALGFPIIVLLYANEADFASWHFHVEGWVGGEAFPPLGVTTQIVPPGVDASWIQDVIPHEIAHLFFYQVAHSELSSWPTWLDEGFAQYFEHGDHNPALEQVKEAGEQGRILPLSHISGTFGSDPERVRLAYAESLSAVVYTFQTWGEGGFGDLVQALSAGRSFREAMRLAFGVSLEEFEAGWLTWLGFPTPRRICQSGGQENSVCSAGA